MMSKTVLDLSESSGEETNDINVNSDFAKHYDNWRRKEEIQKLKDKYGNSLDVLDDSDQSFISGSDDGSDSDEGSDQSVGDQQVFDDNFFKVYSALKTKNPIIYDKNIKFFDKTGNETQIDGNCEEPEEEIKAKTMSLQEYHKKLIKEKKGITDEDIADRNGYKDKPIGYYEELDQIRSEFKTVLNSDDEESDEELIKGKAEPISAVKEVNFLEEDNNDNNDSDIHYLKSLWKNDKQLEESEKFLRDYIIGRKYTEKSDRKSVQNSNFNESNDSDDESTDERVDNGFVTTDDVNNGNEIEPKISKFHFEEPNSVSINRFPRNVETIRDSTVSEKRSLKRVETKERKKKEKKRELKRLRELKREELRQRLQKLQQISGNEGMDLNDMDLNALLDDDKDFDAERYDQKMQSLFGNQFYDNQSESKTKPKFEFMPEIDGIVDDIGSDGNEVNDNQKVNKKLNKKRKKIDKDMQEIGIFEDLIGGDLATRYKYRTVESNDFGLTDEEILFSSDKELNNWCSIKKMSQYRDDIEERYDVKSYSTKATNSELKHKILKTFYEKQNSNEIKDKNGFENDSQITSNDNQRKRRKRKHKKPQFVIQPMDRTPNDSQPSTGQQSESPSNDNKPIDDQTIDEKSEEISNKSKLNKNKRFRKQKRQKSATTDTPYPGVSVERLRAYGLSNRKIKKINHKNRK